MIDYEKSVYPEGQVQESLFIRQVIYAVFRYKYTPENARYVEFMWLEIEIYRNHSFGFNLSASSDGAHKFSSEISKFFSY